MGLDPVRVEPPNVFCFYLTLQTIEKLEIERYLVVINKILFNLYYTFISPQTVASCGYGNGSVTIKCDGCTGKRTVEDNTCTHQVYYLYCLVN